MPKIIVNAFLTLDGVMQAPGAPDEDREGGFLHGGWQAPYADEVMGRLVVEGFADADGFLLGRKTYDIFSSVRLDVEQNQLVSGGGFAEHGVVGLQGA